MKKLNLMPLRKRVLWRCELSSESMGDASLDYLQILSRMCPNLLMDFGRITSSTSSVPCQIHSFVVRKSTVNLSSIRISSHMFYLTLQLYAHFLALCHRFALSIAFLILS